jgi:hypothetical protein
MSEEPTVETTPEEEVAQPELATAFVVAIDILRACSSSN